VRRQPVTQAGTITKRFALAAIAAISFAAPLTQVNAQEVTGRAAVTGAGSTFAYPMVSKWSKAYQRWLSGSGNFPTAAGLDDPPTGSAIDYEPIGSLGGIMRVKEGAVDFGATDMPLASEELQKLGLAQFPIVIGGVVAVVNLDGVGPGQIKFSGELLADIFLGKVQNWSDRAITALNPGLKLPDAKIAVVHRSDGSGTTFNFTDYLSKVSTTWRDKVGSDLLVPWPTGAGARGNKGVSQAVRQTRNSIGYVEYAQAVQSGLSYALIQNPAGKFVKPEASSFQAAAAGADWAKTSDFHLLLTNTPGDAAYPIVATVFALMHKTTAPRKAQAALKFFDWALNNGAQDATDLGYVPLPQALVAQVEAYWAKNLKAGI
jgi:phosphate transport system substrate-binding protein